MKVSPSGWRSYRWFNLLQLLVILILALPLLSVLWAWFSPAPESWQHIRQTLLADYVFNSLLLMALVACFTLLIGVTTAWCVAVLEFPARRLLSWLLVLPLAAPAYIVAYVYTDLLDFAGPVQQFLREALQLSAGEYWFPQIRSLPGAALMLSLVLYPYVYLLAKVAFVSQSNTLFYAARSLGASPGRAFFRIALPAARPAILGGLALVLMETLADFGVVDYFSVPTFATGIFRSWFALGDKAAALKLAAFMLSFVFVLVALEKYQSSRVVSSALKGDKPLQRIPLSGVKAWLVVCWCALPIILGCLLPMSVLIYYALTVGDPMLGKKFSGFILNTLTVATLAALIATCIALLFSYANRVKQSGFIRKGIALATLGYALPGIMLAVGLLAPLSIIDRGLTGWLNHNLGWQGGLLLTGTVAALIYAYVVRFLTVAYNSTNAGLMQIPTLYDDAARTLGATRLRLLQRVQLPLMLPSVVTGLILVFVDVMRELPATLILRPFNFETLATRVYRLASDERIAEASTAALCIVLIGLLPVVALNRVREKI